MIVSLEFGSSFRAVCEIAFVEWFGGIIRIVLASLSTKSFVELELNNVADKIAANQTENKEKYSTISFIH